MSVLRLHLVVMSVLAGILLSGIPGWSDETDNSEGSEKAVEIAKQQREVQAFLALLGDQSSCVTLKAEQACKSSYVTCVDNADAWVVQYMIDPQCEIKTDGRLGVNLLIDVVSGQVISHYPEIEYFDEPDFCLDDPDCLVVPEADSDPPRCLNFIYSPLKSSFVDYSNTACRCRGQHCQLAGF